MAWLVHGSMIQTLLFRRQNDQTNHTGGKCSRLDHVFLDWTRGMSFGQEVVSLFDLIISILV